MLVSTFSVPVFVSPPESESRRPILQLEVAGVAVEPGQRGVTRGRAGVGDVAVRRVEVDFRALGDFTDGAAAEFEQRLPRDRDGPRPHRGRRGENIERRLLQSPTLAFPVRVMTPVFCSEPTVTRVGAVRPPLPILKRPVLSRAPVTVSELPPEGLSP